MKRLIHILTDYSEDAGGPTRTVLDIYPKGSNDRMGDKVICLSSSISRDGICVEISSLVNKSLHRFVLHPYSIASALRNIRRESDIVIFHGLWQPFLSVIAFLLILRRVRYYVFAHGMLDPYFRYRSTLDNVKKTLYWLMVDKVVVRRSNGLIFTNARERQLACKNFPSVRLVNSKLIQLGSQRLVNSSQVERSFARHEFKEKENWLYLGRIDKKKGIDDLIIAFNSIGSCNPQIILDIVGTGNADYIKHLKSRVCPEVVQQVRFLGPLYNEEKANVFYRSSLFILPSHQENFGLAITEAMSTGLPVVTTPYVNISNVIEESRSGIITKDTSPESVRDALEKWMSMTLEQKYEMAANSLSTYTRFFSIDRYREDFLKELLG